MKKYLIYVIYSLSGRAVYEVETSDIFHVIGKMHYYAPERIDYFQFVEDIQFRRNFWKENNVKIREVPDKWKIAEVL